MQNRRGLCLRSHDVQGLKYSRSSRGPHKYHIPAQTISDSSVLVKSPSSGRWYYTDDMTEEDLMSATSLTEGVITDTTMSLKNDRLRNRIQILDIYRVCLLKRFVYRWSKIDRHNAF